MVQKTENEDMVIYLNEDKSMMHEDVEIDLKKTKRDKSSDNVPSDRLIHKKQFSSSVQKWLGPVENYVLGRQTTDETKLELAIQNIKQLISEMTQKFLTLRWSFTLFSSKVDTSGIYFDYFNETMSSVSTQNSHDQMVSPPVVQGSVYKAEYRYLNATKESAETGTAQKSAVQSVATQHSSATTSVKKPSQERSNKSEYKGTRLRRNQEFRTSLFWNQVIIYFLLQCGTSSNNLVMGSSDQVSIKVQEPLVSGEEVHLTCRYQGMPGRNVLLQWILDSAPVFLAKGNVTTLNNTKAMVYYNEKETIYEYIIEEFNQSHLSHRYTCCFHFTCRHIDLEKFKVSFEKHPDDNEFNETIHVNDHNFTAVVQLTGVHPEPSCRFTFEFNLRINQELKKDNNGLFTKSWNIFSMFGSATTPYILNMSCTIGSYSFLKRIVIENETNEVDEEKPRVKFLIPVVIIVTIVLCVTTLFVVVLRKFRNRLGIYKIHKKKQEENSEEIVEMMDINNLTRQNEHEASHDTGN